MSAPVDLGLDRVEFDPSVVTWMAAELRCVPAHRVLDVADGFVRLACGGQRDRGSVMTAQRAREIGAYFCVGCWTQPAKTGGGS